MKKIILLIIIATLSSCKKNENEKYLNLLEKKFDYTKIELENYIFTENTMSDREYCDLMISREQSRKSFDRVDKYLDTLKVFKGNVRFKEVMFYKMKNNDTIHKGYLYFNEKNKIIKSIFKY